LMPNAAGQFTRSMRASVSESIDRVNLGSTLRRRASARPRA
jgi:hypothetical protein